MPVTLTPSFLAVALKAAARSQVSRTALIPCSVKCRVVMKVAIGMFPPRRVGGHRGILSRLPCPGVRWRPPGLGPALATAAAFEVGLRQPVGVRGTMALDVFPARPRGIREAVQEARASGPQPAARAGELP